MKNRLLVTGYGGFVAGSLIWQAIPEWEVNAISRSRAPQDQDEFRCWQFDLCDTETLKKTFAEVKPDAVIHTAALANIDYCESHQGEAERVNVGITDELARLCHENDAKMVFCSTDSIFDGNKGMYSEEDQPQAVNFYAETKIRAEEAVQKYAKQNVMARLSLVMGLSVLGVGNSFLAKMMTTLKAGNEVQFPSNEIRTPVDVITLGRALLELAANDLSGTLHLAGNTCLNRYDMGCQIAERLGYSPAKVVAIDSNAMEGRAPRPNNASLDNSKACAVLNTRMQTLTDGLDLSLALKEKQKNEKPRDQTRFVH